MEPPYENGRIQTNAQKAHSHGGDDQVFVKISHLKEVANAANVIASEWDLGRPDFIVSFITGKHASLFWRQLNKREALRKAIEKIISAQNTLIIDNGLDNGLASIIGSGVRIREAYESEFSKSDFRGTARTRLIGMVPTSLVDSAKQKPAKEKLHQLDRYHSHFVLINQPYENVGRLRFELENQLRVQLGHISTRRNTADGRIIKTSRYMPVVEVVMFVQGGMNELFQIADYVHDDVPVIVLQGCTGTADILADSVSHWKGVADTLFREHIGNRIDELFTGNRHQLDEERTAIVEQICRIMEKEENVSVVDIGNDNEFATLGPTTLQAIMERLPRVADPRQLENYWLLVVRSNTLELARDYIMHKEPYSSMEIPNSALMEALILPDREDLVDLILPAMPVRKFLTHKDYLMLYQNTISDTFFRERVWSKILLHSANDPITEVFLFRDLDRLIRRLTGFVEYINLVELSTNALGLGTRDATRQDLAAMNALIVYAVLFDRTPLIKVLLKYSLDPIPQALFVALLYQKLAKWNTQNEVHSHLVQSSIDFDELAAELFNLGYDDHPDRCLSMIIRKLPEFNNLTTLEIAHKSFALKFLAHPVVHTYIEDYAFGFVRYIGGYGYVKMLAAAFLVFPAYKWLTFPKLMTASQVNRVSRALEGPEEPDTEMQNVENTKRMLADVRAKKYTQSVRAIPTERPPLSRMMYSVWNSPVVKYWIFFVIYHLFLILIAIDIMLPPCMYLGVDIAVFACTALLWLDTVLRVVRDGQYYEWDMRGNGYRAAVDLFLTTAFNILFFLYRIAPYRETNAFSGRVILAFGVLYYWYSVYDLFLTFPSITSSAIRFLKVNMLIDLGRWIIIMIPLTVGTGVVWQAISTPDWPMTGDDWRRAFYRAIFTLLNGGYSMELDYDGTCESTNKINWSNYTQPATAIPADRCWVGAYDNYGCATVSVWSYVLVIHYYFLLKLAMATVLNAYYLHANMRVAPQAPLLARYQRFGSIMWYAGTAPAPWPLSILVYAYQILTFRESKRRRLIDAVDSEGMLQHVDLEAFTFWRGRAMHHFGTKRIQSSALDDAFDEQRSSLGKIKDLVARLQSNVGFLEDLAKRAGVVL